MSLSLSLLSNRDWRFRFWDIKLRVTLVAVLLILRAILKQLQSLIVVPKVSPILLVCICMCMYTCMCVCRQTQRDTQTHTHTHKSLWTSTYMYMRVCIHTHTHTHTYKIKYNGYHHRLTRQPLQLNQSKAIHLASHKSKPYNFPNLMSNYKTGNNNYERARNN